MEHPPLFRLVVGLGNPGERYSRTRHNVGFVIADELARRQACTFHFEKKWDAETASCGGRVLMKPSTFMNLSGEAVGNCVRYFKLSPQEVLVILDDATLPLGDLRFRRSGGSGGHNGLESVLVHLGTEQVPRLRVGIGACPHDIPLDEYVLSRFSTEEEAQVNRMIALAADAAEFANAHGIDPAMNQFNSNQTAEKND